MNPDVADELTRVYGEVDQDDPPDTPDVLRAITTGLRRGGHLAISVAELDEIAAEMSGPPWPN